MTTVEKTTLLNKVVLCDQTHRGRIKYIGPIHGTNNDSGETNTNQNPIIKTCPKFTPIYTIRNLVRNRMVRCKPRQT